MREALSGPEVWRATLMGQIELLEVTDRTDTVVGGYTDFRISGPCSKASIGRGEEGYPPSISIEHPDLPHGGGFVVWTDDGRISFLEYYSNTSDPWPRDEGDDGAKFTFLPHG